MRGGKERSKHGGIMAFSIGDVARIFDAQDGSRRENLAASSSNSVYDLLMHLHADLPRRVT